MPQIKNRIEYFASMDDHTPVAATAAAAAINIAKLIFYRIFLFLCVSFTVFFPAAFFRN